MDSYEKLSKLMRGNQATVNNIIITEMEGPKSCYVNSLKLDKEDLLVSDSIESLSKGDIVAVVKVNSTKYAILGKLVDL